MRLLILGAAAAFSVPAAAQEATASYPTGARVEALIGYESANLDTVLEDGDDDYSFSDSKDFVYGVGFGYDFAAGGAVVGLEAEYMESGGGGCAIDGDELEVACVAYGRDLYAGVRVGVPVSSNTLIYAKGGYANARAALATADLDEDIDFDLDENLHGIRAGAGVELSFSQNMFAKAEYRYTNYEAGFSKHQGVIGIGFRF